MAAAPRFGTIILAAGGSSRMATGHKLLMELAGRPVVRWSVEAALGASTEPGAGGVVVVTGHEAEAVGASIPDHVRVVHNPRWAEGLASSLRAGLEALLSAWPRSSPPSSGSTLSGVFVALGDMPMIRSHHYETTASAWRPGAVVTPTHEGRQGHPVLWPAELFPELLRLEGDGGAKPLLRTHADRVRTVECDAAVLLDVDQEADLDAVREGWPGAR